MEILTNLKINSILRVANRSHLMVRKVFFTLPQISNLSSNELCVPLNGGYLKFSCLIAYISGKTEGLQNWLGQRKLFNDKS